LKKGREGLNGKKKRQAGRKKNEIEKKRKSGTTKLQPGVPQIGEET